ncbi:hypothetical protein MHTCC0001_35600 [Flavobacteriaceae bacterium MHTCC 0001]
MTRIKTRVINLSKILILLLFLSCQNTEENTEKYYPNKNFFDSKKTRKIDLGNNSPKPSKLPILINDIYEEDSLPYFEIIKSKNEVIKIMPLMGGMGNGYYKEDFFLSITQDSILSYLGKNYLLSDLNRILKKHYEDYGKNACVEISIDDDASLGNSALKKTLIKLTSSFENLDLKNKDSIELKVVLSNLRFTPKPPPRPEM